MVRGAVDPEGEPGDDHDTRSGQLTAQLGGDLLAVVGSRTGTDDGDPGPTEDPQIATGEQHGRRLVIGRQHRRVAAVPKAMDGHAGGAVCRQVQPGHETSEGASASKATRSSRAAATCPAPTTGGAPSRSANVRATRRTRCSPLALRVPERSRRSKNVSASLLSGATSSSRFAGRSAFALTPRTLASSRTRATRSATAALLSPAGPPSSSPTSGRASATRRSKRSSTGPESRRPYLPRAASEHRQAPGIDPSPHGHGFMAPTSRKRAGKVTLARARHTRTTPSSSGCLSASRTVVANSPISSRNSTPLWARLISPGRIQDVPPPITETSEAP